LNICEEIEMRSWNILDNSRIWKIKMLPADRMTLLVQTPHEEVLKEYFIPPESLDYNEDGRL
jgi:hypothetical protein